MRKIESKANPGSARSRPEAAKAASRIQPAATRPVNTTLAKIRKAVRKSIQEHAAIHDA